LGDSYTMKIPKDLADFFERYIQEHKELGYKFISQFALHILQEKARELLEDEKKKEPPLEIKNKITLKEGEYSREDLKKLLENIED